MMRVRWTEPAVRDLTRICDYIEKEADSETARRIALVIHQRIDLLKQFPRRGRPGRRPGTLELVFADLPYLTVYRIKDDVIEVIRILHGAQNWP
jgi:toxin ParE1/3/4